MSRTYRFKKAKYKTKIALLDWVWLTPVTLHKVYCDPKSEEGKKRLARCCSDKKWSFYNWKGPSSFHTLFSQRPYRRDVKAQIHRSLRDEDFDVQILRKPKREYW